MSGTLNKAMLIGHLGDDVKIHRFEDGGCIGRFPLATNETYLNKQTNEKVYDITCSNGLKVDPSTHRCPDNGASVNLETCEITPNKGNSCLLYTSPSPRD